MRKLTVTIDGPAGSGKSTVARKLAKRLGFIHLNSGALFRAVGLKAEAEGIPLDDDEAIAKRAAEIEFCFELRSANEGDASTHLFVDGSDLSDEVKTDEAGMLASRIGVLPKLRDVLLQVQRDVALRQSVVVEGRDAGTVVFPDAPVKFYLDAELELRAERRFKELAAKDSSGSLRLEEVLRDMRMRDEREMTREVAPLLPADDAVLIDTSKLSIAEVVERLHRVIKTHMSEELPSA